MKTSDINVQTTFSLSPFFALIYRILQSVNASFDSLRRQSFQQPFSPRISFGHFKHKLKKNLALFLPLLFFGVLLIFLVISFFTRGSGANINATDQRVSIKKPLATQELNKQFTFDVKNEQNEVVRLRVLLKNIELRDVIIYRGQVAPAVAGRVFVIVNLEITNDSPYAVKMNVKDYFRLIVDDKQQKFAPDIHNDPVTIQAISTKATRVGFPIDDTFKNLKLQVGEISGKKEIVNLRLR